MTADQAVFEDLPATPFDACDKRPGRVTSQALVRYKNTDYSVPVVYAHRDVMVKGYVDDIVITSGAEEIARHRRSYDAADFVFDPLHYLALLEQKVGALDQAAPLQGWSLPTEFTTLRRLLESRLSQKNRCAAGKREYVQVLRLVETFPLAIVHGAVRDALRLGAISYDAVKHLALCRIERRPARLDLDGYPHLALTAVATTSASSYMSLLSGNPGMTAASETPELLLQHHLKKLKLPTVLREYEKLARQCAADNVDHVRYLARLIELELIDRDARMVDRRIKARQVPSPQEPGELRLRRNPHAQQKTGPGPGPFGVRRSPREHHRAGAQWCRQDPCRQRHRLGGLPARHQNPLRHRRRHRSRTHRGPDDKRLLRLQRQLASHELLIIDELGFVPLSKTGAELLFELISQRYERGATIITSNLPFDEWTATFGDERLTGALLDRLTHHVHILEMNGPSYRLAQSRSRKRPD